MKLLKAILPVLLILTAIISCSSEPSSIDSLAPAVAATPVTVSPTATATATPTATPTATATATATPMPELVPEIAIQGTSLTVQISPPSNSVIQKEDAEPSTELDPSKCAQITDEGLCILFVELYFSNSGQLIEVLLITNGEETTVDPSAWFQMSDRQAFVPITLKFGHDYEISILVGDTTEGVTGSGSVRYSVK